MDIFDLKSHKLCPALPDNSVVALGNFDGVHLGHTKLIETAVQKAAEHNTVSVVWTFKNNPHIKENHALLTDNKEKCRIFAEMGVDFVVFEDFEAVKSLSPESFVDSILVEALGCKIAVCGYNFHFGFNGEGKASDLQRLFSKKGREVFVIPEVVFNGACVSSTRIRALLEGGETEEAKALLGRPFSVFAPVVEGNHIGRTIGLPTVNQNFPEETIIPMSGIYCSKVEIENKLYFGVSNIGQKPTVGGKSVNLETHILDFDGNLYGKCVRVCLYKKLRDEIKFNSVEKLKEAIINDIKITENYFQIKG